jgi:DivIVA domain-containing protein
MTPDEIRGVTFQQSPLAWRGYSEQEVDDFVASAAHSLDETQREMVALRAEVDRLRNFYRRHGTDVDHSVDTPNEWARPVEPNRLIAEARRYVQTQVGQAEAYADTVRAEGRAQAEEALLHARLRSRILVQDLIRVYFSGGVDQRRAGADLEQLAQWVSALADALWAQTDAMSQAVEAELDHRPALDRRTALDHRAAAVDHRPGLDYGSTLEHVRRQ